MDTLKIFKTYVHVVRASSFTSAADQLGLSRAMVTKHVMHLEKRLGARLINRTTRRFSITDIGREYYEFCVRILDQIENEEGVISGRQNEPRGGLKLLCPKSFGSLHMADAVLDFMKVNPDITITLILTDLSMRSVDFMEGGFDMAVRLSRQRDSERVTRRIGTAQWVTCAAPAYLKAHGEPKNLRDLEEHNCLTHGKHPNWVWRSANAKGRKLNLAGNFVSNSVIALRKAALRGMGLAQLPTYCIGGDLANGTLKRVLPALSLPPEAIHLVFPHGRLLPARSRLFIDFMAKHFKNPPWAE